ncbi:MAG: GGDEF domain-containing phosphodiesterase [Ruminococcus sp.]|nr:GGDEF domain-containing phosphodiesterase [Ruminococcus sp.]
MFYKLMSKEMWGLFEAFYEKEQGPANIVELITRTVPPIARLIGLHHMNCKVDVPKDPVRGRNRFDFTAFDDGIEGKVHLCRTFSTNVNGKVEVYATADTQEASEDFDRFAKLLFMLCGRVITINTLENTMTTDMLSGASNPIGFHKKVGKYYEAGIIDDYAVFYTNIKNFKYINRKIGAQNGDDILRSYVKRFIDFFGDKENGIFRLGADKFILLIKKDQVPDLIRFLKTFDVALPSGISMHIYFNAGIFLADDSCNPNDLLNNASAAFTAAKDGKNGDFVFFEKSMLDDEIMTKSILVTFPQAIKKREFCVYYQPKIDTREKKIVGAEALCRRIQDGKVVPPMSFIPAIERFGRIIQLDLYVLDCVCSDIKGWLDSGIKPPRVSVNISRRDLAELDLAEKICAIVGRYGIPHEYIEIELTETVGSDEFSMMIQLISKLKSKNFTIAIDDFGSGYSTLTMLKSINADVIKLDRAFIKDITPASVPDKTIIRNVINMVNELNIQVIAEGVETAEQVEFLANAGCPVIQGYYFDRPLPKDEYDKRLNEPEYYKKDKR